MLQPTSQPALQEADMHKGPGAQPVCTPHGGVRNPPCLDDATTSCIPACDTGPNPDEREHCCYNICYSMAPFRVLLEPLPLGVLQAMERVGRGAWGHKTLGSSRHR